MKTIRKIVGLFAAIAFTAVPFASNGQIVGSHAYLIGDHVEIGVNSFGHEGAPTLAGSHERGVGANPFGFVANPQLDGWTEYDGDFFTPGTPENGFGFEYGGTRYYSNAASAGGATAVTSAGITDYTVDGDCIYVTVEGTAGPSVSYSVVYKLVTSDLFYTTTVTVTNTSGADIPDFYYYRNFDPDNNQTIGGTYTTTNTIVNQPTAICDKAVVSAEQSTPWDSYVGLGAIGNQFRVCYGGFSNRDASDLWDGISGTFTWAEGSVNVADQAISLSYKIDNLAAGATESFSFVVILDSDQVEAALDNLYFFDYSGGLGGPASACSPVTDTVETCAGIPVTINISGPGLDAYDWVWTPDTGLDTDIGTDIVASPSSTTTYTATGTPSGGTCLTEDIELEIVVEINLGPQIEIIDPGPQCDIFDLTTLTVNDVNSTPGTTTTFHGSIPSGPTDMTDVWPSTTMVSGDIVYVMIADPSSGCYDVQPVLIDFSGSEAAGADNSISLCGEDGESVDLHDLIEPGANVFGSFTETTSSGQFNPATGVLDVSGLDGTYIFTYTVAGTPPCSDDEATFTVNVLAQPNADFHYEVGGLSSEDGFSSACIVSTIDMINESTVPAPGTITGFNWVFGDGGTSSSSDPSYNYSADGTFVIALTVTSNDGCVDTHYEPITIYDNPVLNITSNDPSCFGFNDGSVTVNTSGGSGTYTFEIEDGDGTNLNGTSNTANTLTSGWYYVFVDDGTGCTGEDSVFLEEPGPLDADLIIMDPLCYGDASGVVMVDTVYNIVGPNNAVSYFWSPNPAGISGLGADSSYNMPAGDYTLTINDENGCSNVIDFSLENPPALEFSQFGHDPAYCRQFGYQSGNGVVFAAAMGGTPDYTYEWENLETGDVTSATTWGGLNPGTYQMTVTDANGCTLIQTVEMDSLNPIADFEMNSPQFGQTYEGTLPVEVDFTNLSENFANPNNPNADTTFFWNLDHNNTSWYISDNYNEDIDTVYGISGTYEVCLVAINKNGCTDTTCKELIVYDPIDFKPVNIFTPNGDNKNDVFTFEYKSLSIMEFECVIVDRWGVKVGELTTITDSWNGTDMNGSVCADGVYFYTYKAVSFDGTEFEGQGTVTIVDSQK